MIDRRLLLTHKIYRNTLKCKSQQPRIALSTGHLQWTGLRQSGISLGIAVLSVLWYWLVVLGVVLLDIGEIGHRTIRIGY